jgi:hypothetical protein
VVSTPERAAAAAGVAIGEAATRLRRAQERLLAARALRPQPGRDDKALAAWNGLTLRAFAVAGRVLDVPGLVDRAVRLAEFLLRDLSAPDGGLLRSFRAGQAKIDGFADDYGAVADGLLALHEATGDLRWLEEARRLTETALERFDDPVAGGFFLAAAGGEQLVARTKDLDDNPAPSGTSLLASNLLRLGRIYGRPDWEARAEAAVRLVRDTMTRAPQAFGRLLGVLDQLLAVPREVAVVGRPGSAGRAALLAVLDERPDPRRVVVVGDPDDPRFDAVPLLAGRGTVDGAAAAYVCERFACRRPVPRRRTCGCCSEHAPADGGAGAGAASRGTAWPSSSRRCSARRIRWRSRAPSRRRAGDAAHVARRRSVLRLERRHGVRPGTDRRTAGRRQGLTRAAPADPARCRPAHPGHAGGDRLPGPRTAGRPRAVRERLAVVDAYLPGDTADAHDPPVRTAMAACLARLVRDGTPAAASAGALDVLDLAGRPGRPRADALWGAPHSPLFDLEGTAAGAEWIEAPAWPAKTALARPAGRTVLGHIDWSVKNLGWDGAAVVAVYDWDSLVVAPEPVLVGRGGAGAHGHLGPARRACPDARGSRGVRAGLRGGAWTAVQRCRAADRPRRPRSTPRPTSPAANTPSPRAGGDVQRGSFRDRLRRHGAGWFDFGG